MKTTLCLLAPLLFVTAGVQATQHVEDFDGALDPYFNHTFTSSNWGFWEGYLALNGGTQDEVTFDTLPGEYVDWASVYAADDGYDGTTVEFVGTLDSASFSVSGSGTFDTTGLELGEITSVRLTADGTEVSLFDDLTINVVASNQPPIADAGPDQTVTDTNRNGSEPVTLDGSGSSDPDGTIQSYVWKEGATQIGTGVNPTVTLSVGVHTITLTVTDDDAASDADTVAITVNSPPNQPPVAVAGMDAAVFDTDGNGSEDVELDGSSSYDPDGTIQSYVWTEGAVQLATGVNPTVSLAVGEHVITLKVTDNNGAWDTDTVKKTVIALPNKGPSADAGSDRTVVDLNRDGREAVTLDGSGSSDSDGTIKSYNWTEGAEQLAYSTSPSADVTLAVGTHTITLTVTDDDGVSDTDTVTITVQSPPNIPPTANAGPNQTLTVDYNDTRIVTLDGSGSTDPDGTIVSYNWTEGTQQLAYSADPRADVNLPSGTHTITLTVMDNDGATATDTVVIVIQALIPMPLPPTANAGPDRCVRFGENVVLDGSGSARAVSFHWTQIDGPSVLPPTGVATATASFTAPPRVQSMTFHLTVKGSGGTNEDEVIIMTLEDPGNAVFVSSTLGHDDWVPHLDPAIQTDAGMLDYVLRLLGGLGSMNLPVQTLEKALELATAQEPHKDIHIHKGDYYPSATLVIPDGVSLYGGFQAESVVRALGIVPEGKYGTHRVVGEWKRELPENWFNAAASITRAHPTTIHSAAAIALSVRDVISSTTIDGLTIISQDGADGAGHNGAGENSIGIHVQGSDEHLAIVNNQIFAAKGGNGRQGIDGVAEDAGSPGEPGEDGPDWCLWLPCLSCSKGVTPGTAIMCHDLKKGNYCPETDEIEALYDKFWPLKSDLHTRGGEGGAAKGCSPQGQGGRGGDSYAVEGYVPNALAASEWSFEESDEGDVYWRCERECVFNTQTQRIECQRVDCTDPTKGYTSGHDAPYSYSVSTWGRGGMSYDESHPEVSFVSDLIKRIPKVGLVLSIGFEWACKQEGIQAHLWKFLDATAGSSGHDGWSGTGGRGGANQGDIIADMWVGGFGKKGQPGEGGGYGGNGGGAGWPNLGVAGGLVAGYLPGGAGGGGGGGGCPGSGATGGAPGGGSFGIMLSGSSPAIQRNVISTGGGGDGEAGGRGGEGGAEGQPGKGGASGCMSTVCVTRHGEAVWSLMYISGTGREGGRGGYGGTGAGGGGGSGGASCGIYLGQNPFVYPADNVFVDINDPGRGGRGGPASVRAEERIEYLSKEEQLAEVQKRHLEDFLASRGEDGEVGQHGDICPPPGELHFIPFDPTPSPEVPGGGSVVYGTCMAPGGMSSIRISATYSYGNDVGFDLVSPSGWLINNTTTHSSVRYFETYGPVYGAGIYQAATPANTGVRITSDLRIAQATDVTVKTYVILNPEAGQWTVRLQGLDVPPEGIEVLLSAMGTPAGPPPVADAGPDQTVECTSPAGAEVTLDGSASAGPGCCGAVVYRWTNADGLVVGATLFVDILLRPGVHTFTLTVDNGQGGTDTDTVTITVQDTTPPLITLNGDRAMSLTWGRDRYVEPGASALDLRDEDVVVVIGGDAVDDRTPGTYTVTYEATDVSGNAAQATRTVHVVNVELAEEALAPLDHLLTFVVSQGQLNPRTGLYMVTVTVTNTSQGSILAPVMLVVESVSNASVTLRDYDATTPEGKRMVNLSRDWDDPAFEPGESATVRLYFDNPAQTPFSLNLSLRGMAWFDMYNQQYDGDLLAEACAGPAVGELTGDCRVDLKDFAVFASQWRTNGQSNEEPAPVAHWELDETAGTTAHDSVGRNHGQVLCGSGSCVPLWRPTGGCMGGALQLDGDGDAIRVPTIRDSVEFTYALWVKQDVIRTGLAALIEHRDWRPGSVRFDLMNGHPRVAINEATWPRDDLDAQSHILPSGEWHHVAVAKSVASLAIFVDGGLAAYEGLTASGPVTLGDGFVGSGSGERWFKGLLDDVRIYDTALRLDQVRALFKAGKASLPYTAPPKKGTVTREIWEGIVGSAVEDLRGNAHFPDNPSRRDELSAFDFWETGLENYGSRTHGYLHPNTSGEYTFWIASDDNGELWLSTDDNPANAVMIANVPGWTGWQEWDKYPEQKSASVILAGGQKYYIMALQEEKAGDDHLSVAWQGPDCPARAVISGNYLSPIVADDGAAVPNLVAHWKLDEVDAQVAHDSAGPHDGTLAGNPAWRQTGGVSAGALLFDGVNDYVLTDFVLNPAQGAFSVFAWVKGGLPGQTVIAQAGAADWLFADPLDGTLMTDLKGPGAHGRGGRALRSDAVITDDVWHHVGLVRDGASRILYADGVEVAGDTQADLAGSEQGLYVGTGKDRRPDSYWRGLLDDIRIYDCALAPDDIINEVIIPALGPGPSLSDFDGNGRTDASDLATFAFNWLRCYRLLPGSCWGHALSGERQASHNP